MQSMKVIAWVTLASALLHACRTTSFGRPEPDRFSAPRYGLAELTLVLNHEEVVQALRSEGVGELVRVQLPEWCHSNYIPRIRGFDVELYRDSTCARTVDALAADMKVADAYRITMKHHPPPPYVVGQTLWVGLMRPGALDATTFAFKLVSRNGGVLKFLGCTNV